MSEAKNREVAAGETEPHRELKRLAAAWARANRLGLVATEVRLPRSGYRADVAAASMSAGTRRKGKQLQAQVQEALG